MTDGEGASIVFIVVIIVISFAFVGGGGANNNINIIITAFFVATGIQTATLYPNPTHAYTLK